MRLAEVFVATLGVVLGLLCVQSHVDTSPALHKNNTPKHKKVRLKEVTVVMANDSGSIDDMIKKIAAGRQDGRRITDENGTVIAYTNGIVKMYDRAAHDEYLRRRNERIALSRAFRKAHEHIEEIVNISIAPRHHDNGASLSQQLPLTVSDGRDGPEDALDHIDARIMTSDSRAGDSGLADTSDKSGGLTNLKLSETTGGTSEELNPAESEKNGRESGDFENVTATSVVTEDNHLQGTTVNPNTRSPATKQQFVVSSVDGLGVKQKEANHATKKGENITNGKPPGTLNAHEDTRNGQSTEEIPEQSLAAGTEGRKTQSTTAVTPGAGENERTESGRHLTQSAPETDAGAYDNLHAINMTTTPTTLHAPVSKMKHHEKTSAVATNSTATIKKHHRAMQKFSGDIPWQAKPETQKTTPVPDDGLEEKYGGITSEPRDGGTAPAATERGPKMLTLAAASTAEKHEHQECPHHEPYTPDVLSASIYGHGDSTTPRNYEPLPTKTRYEDKPVAPAASVLEARLNKKVMTEKSVRDLTTSLGHQEVKPRVIPSSFKGKNEETILEIPISYGPVSRESEMVPAFTRPASEAYEDNETTPLSIKYHTSSKEYPLGKPQTTVHTSEHADSGTRNSYEPGSPSKVHDGKVVSADAVPELDTYENDREIRPKSYNNRASMLQPLEDAARDTTALYSSANEHGKFRIPESFKSTFLNVAHEDKMATEFAAPGSITNQKNEQPNYKPHEYIKARLEVPHEEQETIQPASTGTKVSEESEVNYSYGKFPLASAATSEGEKPTSKYYQYFTPAPEGVAKESHTVAAPYANLPEYEGYWATTDSKAADMNVYNEPTYDTFIPSPARQRTMHSHNTIPAAYTYKDYQMSSDNELRKNKHPKMYYVKQTGHSTETNGFDAPNAEMGHKKITDYSTDDETSFSHLGGAPSENIYHVGEMAPNIYDFPHYNDNRQNFKFLNVLNEDGTIPYPEEQERIFEEQNNPDQNALVRNFEENSHFLGTTQMKAPVQMKDEQSRNDILVHAFPKIPLLWERLMPERPTVWQNTNYRIPQGNFKLNQYRPRYNTGYLAQELRAEPQNTIGKQELYTHNMEYEPYTPNLYTRTRQVNIIPSDLHEFTLYDPNKHEFTLHDQSENNPENVLWSDMEPETYRPTSILTEQYGTPQNYNGESPQYPNNLLLNTLDVPYEKPPDMEFSDREDVNAHGPVPKNVPSGFLDKLQQYADNWIAGRTALGTEIGNLYFPYSRKQDIMYAKTGPFVKDSMLGHNNNMFDKVSLSQEFNRRRLYPGTIENGVFDRHEYGEKRQIVRSDQIEELGNYIKGPKQNARNILHVNGNFKHKQPPDEHNHLNDKYAAYYSNGIAHARENPRFFSVKKNTQTYKQMGHDNLGYVNIDPNNTSHSRKYKETAKDIRTIHGRMPEYKSTDPIISNNSDLTETEQPIPLPDPKFLPVLILYKLRGEPILERADIPEQAQSESNKEFIPASGKKMSVKFNEAHSSRKYEDHESYQTKKPAPHSPVARSINNSIKVLAKGLREAQTKQNKHKIYLQALNELPITSRLLKTVQNSHDNEKLYKISPYEAPYLQHKIPHTWRRIIENFGRRMPMFKPVNVPVKTVPMAPTPESQQKYEDIYEDNANKLPLNIESTLQLDMPHTGQKFPEKFKAHLVRQISMPKTNHFYTPKTFPGYFPIKFHSSDQPSSTLDALITHISLPQETYITPADKQFLTYAGQEEMIGNSRSFNEDNYEGDLRPCEENEGLYKRLARWKNSHLMAKINPVQTANYHGTPSSLYRRKYEFDYPSSYHRLQSTRFTPLTKPVEKRNPFKKYFQAFWDAGKEMLTKPNMPHSVNTRHFTKRETGSDFQTLHLGEFGKARCKPTKSVRNKVKCEQTRHDEIARTRMERRYNSAEENLQIYDPESTKKPISKNKITSSAPFPARKHLKVFHPLSYKITPKNYTKHKSSSTENISDCSESHASYNGKKSGMVSGKLPHRYLNDPKTKFDKAKKLYLQTDKQYPTEPNNKLLNSTLENLMQTGKTGLAKPLALVEHKTNKNTPVFRAGFGYDKNIQALRGVNPETAQHRSKSDYHHLQSGLQNDFGINTRIKESVKSHNNQAKRDTDTTDYTDHLNNGRKELMKTTVHARKVSPSEIHTTNYETMLTAAVSKAKYHYPAEHEATNLEHHFNDSVSENVTLEVHIIPYTRKVSSAESYATNSLGMPTQVKFKRDINAPQNSIENVERDESIEITKRTPGLSKITRTNITTDYALQSKKFESNKNESGANEKHHYQVDSEAESLLDYIASNLSMEPSRVLQTTSESTNATSTLSNVQESLKIFRPVKFENSTNSETDSDSPIRNNANTIAWQFQQTNHNPLHSNFPARTRTEYVTTVPGPALVISTLHQDISNTMNGISENATQQNGETQNIDNLTQSSSTQTVTPNTDIWMRGMEFNKTIFHDLQSTGDILPGKNDSSSETSHEEDSQDFQPTQVYDESSTANSHISREEEYEVYGGNHVITHMVSEDSSYTPSYDQPTTHGRGENLLGSTLQTNTSGFGMHHAKQEVEHDNLPGIVMPNSHHLVHLTLIKVVPSQLLERKAGQLQGRHVGEHIHLVVKLNNKPNATRFVTVPELLRKGFVKLLHPPGALTERERRGSGRRESLVHVVHAA